MGYRRREAASQQRAAQGGGALRRAMLQAALQHTHAWACCAGPSLAQSTYAAVSWDYVGEEPALRLCGRQGGGGAQLGGG